MARMGWPGHGGREPAFDWAGHERRAADLVADLRSVARRGYHRKSDNHEAHKSWLERARESSPQARTSLLLLLIRQSAAAGGGWMWGLSGLGPRQCAATHGGAACAPRTAARAAGGVLAVT